VMVQALHPPKTEQEPAVEETATSKVTEQEPASGTPVLRAMDVPVLKATEVRFPRDSARS